MINPPEIADEKVNGCVIWTFTNNNPGPLEIEVCVASGTRVISVVPSGSFVRIIAANSDDVNMKHREARVPGEDSISQWMREQLDRRRAEVQ